MIVSYSLTTDNLPTIPVPHDCIIKEIRIENQCVVFVFEDDISDYESIAYWHPQAKSLIIRYHFTESVWYYDIYRWVKPNLSHKQGCYKFLTDGLDEKHTTLLSLTKSRLEYIDHYVGFGYGGHSVIIKLYSAAKGEIIMAGDVDVIEYDWKD